VRKQAEWFSMRTFRLITLMLAAVANPSCDRIERSADQSTSVWYSHSGCYGSCPNFEIHVDRAGHASFEGHAYTATKGKRQFSVTPQQFQAFRKAVGGAKRLAKPFDKAKNIYDQINADLICPPNASYHTDDTGIFIMWSGPGGEVYYSADYGCDADRNKKLYDTLDSAPNTLGLKKMIGEPTQSTAP
jgi:hypothetical protein